jgi:hypothetical protein
VGTTDHFDRLNQGPDRIPQEYPIHGEMDIRFQPGAVCEEFPNAKRLVQPWHPPGPCVGGYRRAHHPDGLVYVFTDTIQEDRRESCPSPSLVSRQACPDCACLFKFRCLLNLFPSANPEWNLL